MAKVHRVLIAGIVEALDEIFVDGRHADKAIERHFKGNPKWGARDRRQFAEAVYEITRWWRWYWHLAGLDARRGLGSGDVSKDELWRVWEAYFIDTTGEPSGLLEAGSLTPRQVRENRQAKVPAAVASSLPDWLQELGEKEIGTGWPELVKALNRPAEVFLRTNTLRNRRDELGETLATSGIETESVPGLADALKLAKRQNIFTSPAFREGLFEVQDAASQQIAPFLQVEPGQRVIDACAGAGGKTLHLACLMRNKGRIVALDVHGWKLDELRKRAARNGVDVVETRVADPKTVKRLRGTADRVLLDVPCSGLGVLRRNPDAKWKLQPEEIARLQNLQAEILADYSRLAKPGGKLVYATCSILPGENERQTARFLESETGRDWELEEERHWRPDREGFDGFYAARLRRRA